MRCRSMSELVDRPDQTRFEMAFPSPEGERLVFARYVRRDGVLVIPHVEADPALRGSGAAGRFMRGLADHARAEGLRLIPTCGYAAAWFRRHPDEADLLA